VFGTPFDTTDIDTAFSTSLGDTVTAIDWDGVGGIQDNKLNDVNNLNINGCGGSFGQIHQDFNDWENIVYDFRNLAGGSFDGPTDRIEINLNTVIEGASQGNWYDGLLVFHELNKFGNEETLGGSVGGVVNLSFQYFTCDPNNTGEDTCIDENKIVKQIDFYNNPNNAREVFSVPVPACVLGDERAECNEQLLAVLDDREIFMTITGPNDEDLGEVGPFHFEEDLTETSADAGWYHFAFNTTPLEIINGGPGPGTYALTFTDKTPDNEPELFDFNSNPQFRQAFQSGLTVIETTVLIELVAPPED